MIKDAPYNAETPKSHLADSTTPSPGVYVRNHFETPVLQNREHHIKIDGAVRSTYQLTVDELYRMPRTRVTCTMECAGNDRASMLPLPIGEPWTSGAVSTAEWTGVRLLEILERASPLDGALEVLVEGADKGICEGEVQPIAFARSLPIDSIGPDVLLAFEMNGAPLTVHHGAPVRLVVPGWYGMASVKWVSRITVLSTPYTGYFQRNRYVYETGSQIDPVTRIRVKSMIVSPTADAIVPVGNLSVWGWAWSGYGPIKSVQVAASADGPWIDAELENSSPHTWVRWQCKLRLGRSGRHVLRSCATDLAGNVQPWVVPWNRFGYGNNAVRQVKIVARDSTKLARVRPKLVRMKEPDPDTYPLWF
jgi:DMSO/TMAO reductase YedYZ molybdopterin-dependent catalytic subunit